MFLDMITRFQGTGPNIKCFNKGYVHLANEKMLLVNINFICVIILTKFFKVVNLNSLHIICVFHQKHT